MTTARDLIQGVSTTHAAQDAAQAALVQAQSNLVHAEADVTAADSKLAENVKISPIVDDSDPADLKLWITSESAPGYTTVPARGLDAVVTDG